MKAVKDFLVSVGFLAVMYILIKAALFYQSPSRNPEFEHASTQPGETKTESAQKEFDPVPNAAPHNREQGGLDDQPELDNSSNAREPTSLVINSQNSVRQFPELSTTQHEELMAIQQENCRRLADVQWEQEQQAHDQYLRENPDSQRLIRRVRDPFNNAC